MNSYADPAHEEEAAALLRKLLPDAYVTVSTELTREWYEYERCSTVAANAYVGPQVSTYIRRLESDLEARNFDGSLFMMGSNGGLLSVERTCRQPIGLVESGPIGGCIGAGAYAGQLGYDNVVAFDMGGTTAKCALVENGRFSVDSVYYVNGYVQGFPIKSPVIDIVEVGSGGGSIAWLDDQKRLHVGPQSAGSTPGPVCYGRGGTEPTVTDANLVLGRLNPDHFLGGELSLDTEAARRAIADKIADPLGYTGEDGLIRMADGIISIATVVMAGAIRRVSVEHGLDPRDFVLFSYGGGGPLHASQLAHELSIPTVVIPPEPGNFSAIGMLLADARLDISKTFVGALGARHGRRHQGAVRRDGSRGGRRARRGVRRAGDRFRAPRRDALQGPAPQHQGAGVRPRRCGRDPRRVRARLQAPLRPRRCQGRGRVPGAASVRFRAPQAARHRAPAAQGHGRARKSARARSISAAPAGSRRASSSATRWPPASRPTGPP